MNIKAILDRHKVTASFIGGALVVSTAYGTCQYTPGLGGPGEEAAAEPPAEVEAGEEAAAPAEEPSEAKEDDASEGK